MSKRCTKSHVLSAVYSVPRRNVPRQNLLRHKVPRTKGPKRQNVPWTKCPKDKTSQGTKCPKGLNVPRDKTSQGTKRPKVHTKRPKEKKFYNSISNFSTDFVCIFWKWAIYVRYYYFGQVRQGHSFKLAMLDYVGNGLHIYLWIGLFLLWGD